MGKILGVSGRKQAGKNTVANILHGIVLEEKELIKDWSIDSRGQLQISTTNSEGKQGWGYFWVHRKDEEFIEYAECNMWPYVKLYSFADSLKSICMNLFDIPFKSLYGTDEDKNQIQEHLLWKNIPGSKRKKGAMTSREFMQYFGTDIMRKIHEPVWVNACINKIKQEQSELAIIADVRFPNEAKAIEDAGGIVLRLNRKIHEDNHSSEIALDDYPFTDRIDNENQSIDELVVKVKQFYSKLKEVQ